MSSIENNKTLEGSFTYTPKVVIGVSSYVLVDVRFMAQMQQLAKQPWYYGCIIDSVPPYTPLTLKDKKTGNIEVIPISDVAEFFDDNSSQQESVPNKQYMVLDKKGNWTDVKRVYRHPYNGKLIRILTGRGVVDASPNHSVYRKFRGRNDCADAKTIKVGDSMTMPCIDYFTPTHKIKEYGLWWIGTEELAWLYGFIVAEGHISLDNWCITLSNNDITLLEKAQDIIEKYINVKCGMDIGSYPQEGITNLPVYRLSFAKKQLALLLREMFYTKDGLKKIPTEVLNAPNKFKQAFINGYIAGDGSKVTKSAYAFTTNSPTLAEGLLWLFRCLHYKSHNTYIDQKHDKSYITIVINKGNGIRKINEREVKKVYEIDYKGYLYDIETESHTFAGGVGQFILHNTAKPIDQSRNNIVQKFLIDQPEATHLLFLDNDVLVPPNGIETLLQINQPVVSGLIVQKMPPYYPLMNIRIAPETYRFAIRWPEGQITAIDAVGMGCVLIRRDGLQKIEPPYFKFANKQSEDYYYCEKVQAAGMQILAHTGVICGHIGDRVYTVEDFKPFQQDELARSSAMGVNVRK